MSEPTVEVIVEQTVAVVEAGPVLSVDGQVGAVDLTATYVPRAAPPTGVDDTATIQDALTNRKVLLPGTYVYLGAGEAPGAEWALRALLPGATTVTIPAAGYLIDDATAWVNVLVENIEFSGGAGVVRGRYAGVNVTGKKIMRNCEFINQTGCSVQSNAGDEPYWTFDNCRWNSANDTTTIHVALAGQADACIFNGCTFEEALIQVKLSNPNSARFIGCDFIPWSGGTAGHPRARVWLVPAGSSGPTFTGCKFGSEGLGATPPDVGHILIADEGAGTYVGERLPVTGADSTATLPTVTVEGSCEFYGANTTGIPFVYSTTPNIQSGHIAGQIVGTPPDYVVQFRTPATVENRLTEHVLIGPIVPTDSEGLLPTMTNAAGAFGHPIDPGYVLVTDPVTPLPGSGDPADFVQLSPPALPGWNTDGWAAGLTGTTDALGGSEAANAAFPGTGNILYGYLATTPTIGRLAWIEFDLKAGAASPLARINFSLTFDGAGPSILKRSFRVPAGWTRYRVPVSVLQTGANMICQFQAPGAGQLKVGRVRVYHSRSPHSSDAAVFTNTNSRIFTVTGAPAVGIGADGDFAFRVDTPGTANQRLYVKSAGAWVGIV